LSKNVALPKGVQVYANVFSAAASTTFSYRGTFFETRYKAAPEFCLSGGYLRKIRGPSASGAACPPQA